MDLWMYCVLKPIPAGRPTYIVHIRTPSAIRNIVTLIIQYFFLYTRRSVNPVPVAEPFHAKLDGVLHRLDWKFVNELVFDEKKIIFELNFSVQNCRSYGTLWFLPNSLECGRNAKNWSNRFCVRGLERLSTQLSLLAGISSFCNQLALS